MFLVFIDNESGTRRDYQLAMFWVATFHYSTTPILQPRAQACKNAERFGHRRDRQRQAEYDRHLPAASAAHADLAKQVPTFATCAGIGTPEQRLAEQDRRASIARGLRIENFLPTIAMTKGAAHVG
jgi:hypothetical protein